MFRKSVQVHGESPCLGSREILADGEVSGGGKKSFFFGGGGGATPGERKKKLEINFLADIVSKSCDRSIDFVSSSSSLRYLHSFFSSYFYPQRYTNKHIYEHLLVIFNLKINFNSVYSANN